MNLRNLSDDQLHSSTVRTAEKQREITLVLLNHLNEIERRHLYSKFDCSSLHGYCVKELKMTSGTACHYKDAARLLKQVPELKEKISDGTIAMTTVASAEAFFKREARNGNKLGLEEKQEILSKLDSLATREADKVLISHSAKPEIHLKEKVTQRTETIVELKVHLDEEAMAALQRLKEVWSHAMPHASFGDLIKRAAKEAVEKNDPLKKVECSEVRARKTQEKHPERKPDKTPAPGFEASPTEVKSKAEIRRAIWKRDQAQCTFTDPRTGDRCKARHFVEEDHITPKALGGKYTLENMRLRCRAHNQRHAINTFGMKLMQEYLN